ncbi:hypothetical protein [Actinacidiphila rubida]|nr:hypothetical protein [Actinacidiphila rubida]
MSLTPVRAALPARRALLFVVFAATAWGTAGAAARQKVSPIGPRPLPS